MKALINCSESGTEWAKNFFEGANLYLLPIAGKPLIEYYLDLCSNLKVEELQIVDANYSWMMEEFLGNGEKWALKIEYTGGNFDLEYSELLKRKQSFAGNSEVLIINGFFMPDFDIRNFNGNEADFLPQSQSEQKSGIFLYNDGEYFELNARCTRISTIQDYFEANMQVIEKNYDYYILPGYRMQNGIYSGMNVEIPPHCEITPPLILGNNVRFGESVRLIGPAAISDNSIIDNNSLIKRSIILPGTYVGADLEISGKIIDRQNIIDASTGAIFRNQEQDLTGDTIGKFSFKRFIQLSIEYVFALLIFLIQTIPWIIFVTLIGVRAVKKITIILPEQKKILYRYYQPNSIRNLYFMKLSLDKYTSICHLLRGRLRLVSGHVPMELMDEHDTIILPRMMNIGVFNFSESFNIHKNQLQQDLDDRYFRNNYSCSLAVIVAIKAMIIRLLIGRI